VNDALAVVQTVLVLGGASEIGVAIAVELARPRQATVVLAGRRPSALEAAAGQVRAAGAGRVETLPFDALDTDSHDAVLARAVDLAADDLDVVVVAAAILDGPPAQIMATNYVGAGSACLAAAKVLKTQGHGTLVVLSSVAGERVRRANFVYGSSKAGLDGLAQGLGDDLAGTGVKVLVVRPGFVKGRMTAGRPPAPLATTPAAVARATAAALAAGREVVWVPPALRIVFAGFRHLPRVAWRRLPG
jgi:decaprenylphospho-beta-D-erythro-pentofuranosid-2-ulose 2-reductase